MASPVEIQPILDWFEDGYLGHPMHRGRRAATDPYSTWTAYERTLNGENRTNNFAEAAHRRLQAEFGVDHPSLWRFIDGIRLIQAGRDRSYEDYIRGQAPPVKRIRYQRADDRILAVVRDFGNRTTLEYLRGIAHNFEM